MFVFLLYAQRSAEEEADTFQPPVALRGVRPDKYVKVGSERNPDLFDTELPREPAPTIDQSTLSLSHSVFGAQQAHDVTARDLFGDEQVGNG